MVLSILQLPFQRTAVYYYVCCLLCLRSLTYRLTQAETAAGAAEAQIVAQRRRFATAEV
jgi:hypothetical protein